MAATHSELERLEKVLIKQHLNKNGAVEQRS
jgi:hypothetical protein